MRLRIHKHTMFSHLLAVLLSLGAATLMPSPGAAQEFTISTVAGTGEIGDGGPATQAQLAFPTDVAVDGAGNLYIADAGNHRIRRVDPSGSITTIAGTGERGFAGDGGPATHTTTPAGKLTFHIFAALAEFERDMIRERTSAGLPAAHKRGVAIGRPRALTPEQILMAEAMTADPAISTRQVAEQFGIHRSTLYRHLNGSSETLRLACKIAPILPDTLY